MVCSGQLSCCTAQYRSSFSCWSDWPITLSCIQSHLVREYFDNTERFMVHSMQSAQGARQAHIIIPPPPCFTAVMRSLCFVFCQMLDCALWPDISTLVLSVQRTLFYKVCSDADYAVLPFSFTSGCTSRQAILFFFGLFLIVLRLQLLGFQLLFTLLITMEEVRVYILIYFGLVIVFLFI